MKPQIIGHGRTLFIDVDGTLIRPAEDTDNAGIWGCEPPAVLINGYRFIALTRNVDTVRRFAANADTTIIVWSAGGAIWADQAVRALGLEDVVDVCMSKPVWYLDNEKDAGFVGNPAAWIDANAS